MSKPAPARDRATHWTSCSEALKQRGSLLIWRDKEMVWLAPKVGCTGRPPVFSDAAIRFRLMVKVLFGVPLRQTAGKVSGILRMALMIQADATPLSFRSAGTADCGKRTLRQPEPTTISCARPAALGGRSGSGGQAITFETGPR